MEKVTKLIDVSVYRLQGLPGGVHGMERPRDEVGECDGTYNARRT